jgi:hypothetical protein
MAIPACTEDEFISLWAQHQSAAALAKILSVDVRNIQIRRNGIQRRRGIVLASTDPRSPTFNVTIPQNGVRVNVEIDGGVILVASDCHYWPGIISTAHRALVTATKELRPKMVVINGDAFDGSSISRHDRIMWEARPNVKQELEAVSDRLGEIEAVAANAKLHWTWGNHDMRFNTRLSGHAAQFEGVRGFSLADHFLRWKFSTSIMVNGHTMIKHRWHNGVHATWNNTLKSGTSMVTGHLHALGVRPYTDYNGTRYAVDTGTLAYPVGEQFTYGEDSPANHRSGFAVLTFYDGKLLPPELLEVIDEDAGLVCFRGQVVKV